MWTSIARTSSVYDWEPKVLVPLFHGRDDTCEPCDSAVSAVSTVKAMQARGAGKLVSLTDCQAQPAGHLPCVAPFFGFMLDKLGSVAKDL